MKQFLKFTFASALGIIIATFTLVAIIGIAASSGESEALKLSEAHILKLDLMGTIQDRVAENPFDIYGELMGSNNSAIGLNDLLSNIYKAKNNHSLIPFTYSNHFTVNKPRHNQH